MIQCFFIFWFYCPTFKCSHKEVFSEKLGNADKHTTTNSKDEVSFLDYQNGILNIAIT